MFNNVAHDIPGCSNYFNLNQTGGPGGGNAALYNNTFVDPTIGATGGGSVSSINNHWVATPATAANVYTTGSSYSESSATYMTDATATADGYTFGQRLRAYEHSSPTVTAAGTNHTSFCSGLTNTAAATACAQGFSGVSYNATNHTVVVPAITAIAQTL